MVLGENLTNHRSKKIALLYWVDCASAGLTADTRVRKVDNQNEKF